MFCSRRLLLLLIPDPLHLAAGDLLLAAIVELGRARIGVAGDLAEWQRFSGRTRKAERTRPVREHDRREGEGVR